MTDLDLSPVIHTLNKKSTDSDTDTSPVSTTTSDADSEVDPKLETAIPKWYSSPGQVDVAMAQAADTIVSLVMSWLIDGCKPPKDEMLEYDPEIQI